MNLKKGKDEQLLNFGKIKFKINLSVNGSSNVIHRQLKLNAITCDFFVCKVTHHYTLLYLVLSVSFSPGSEAILANFSPLCSP